MTLSFSWPVIMFPLIATLVQSATSTLPHPDIWEKYGPWGVIVAWLMAAQFREEKRRDKRDAEQAKTLKDIASTLGTMRDRPCLYELETGEQASHRKHHGD